MSTVYKLGITLFRSAGAAMIAGYGLLTGDATDDAAGTYVQ
jgi:hypothetical protein